MKIREPSTHLPPKGVTVGDLGEKIALNGVDNGFLSFEHYRIPRTALLNKQADVTPDGKYVAAIKDKSKRFGKLFFFLVNLMDHVELEIIC